MSKQCRDGLCTTKIGDRACSDPHMIFCGGRLATVDQSTKRSFGYNEQIPPKCYVGLRSCLSDAWVLACVYGTGNSTLPLLVVPSIQKQGFISMLFLRPICHATYVDTTELPVYSFRYIRSHKTCRSRSRNAYPKRCLMQHPVPPSTQKQRNEPSRVLSTTPTTPKTGGGCPDSPLYVRRKIKETTTERLRGKQ